ncbi:MAG: hypothetical protein C0592_02000 [Marinilabiliales bacterium]|nr:MAG: hypothetical protein C0592_02000 [Marinilabiliales bacterium]
MILPLKKTNDTGMSNYSVLFNKYYYFRSAMKRLKAGIIFLFIFHGVLFAQEKKSIHAVFTDNAPKIDGHLNDPCWNNAEVNGDFTQYSPYHGNKPTQKTEVKLLYNHRGIFVAATCYDTAPDSILRQLGDRDENLNSDMFSILIDPYANNQDAYVFEVFASGPQADWRYNDGNYNTVWESATFIHDKGWNAEFFIPYSALRFPKQEVQNWKIQFSRQVRRSREISQWALEDRTADIEQEYWGTVTGIENIDPPLRLSLNPYFSAGITHYPYNTEGVSNYSTSWNGGLDLKWGISEAYTVDLTLLPDFSQVQSDDIVKNLSAFETQYSEQRLFFKEAIDLFQQGGLFYTRRIGRLPSNFFSVYDSLQTGETMLNNPSQAKLLNAFKFSGRSKNGLAVGVFNAITGNTYAEIQSEDGTTRKLLTEPMANYNIMVIDKVFKNNNSFYLINTNAMREKEYHSSNSTAAGASFYDKSHTYKASVSGAVSDTYNGENGDYTIKDIGYSYGLSLSKVSGKLKLNASHSAKNEYFDINDMGILYTNNYRHFGTSGTYSWYTPVWKFKEMYLSAGVDNILRMTNGNPTGNEFWLTYRFMTMKHFFLMSGFSTGLSKTYDYYEPRNSAYYYLEPLWHHAYLHWSSSYSKPFALDGQLYYTSIPEYSSNKWDISIEPILKIGNRVQLQHEFRINRRINEVGYAGTDTTDLPLFGKRDVDVIENTLELKYTIKNYMPISLRIRHYYSEGNYSEYFPLMTDGHFGNSSAYPYDYDFTFNTFNIDLIYSWQFSPGSTFSLIWKNSILKEDNPLYQTYFENFENTLSANQYNSLTLKVIYYIDYEQITDKRSVK